MPVSVTDYGVWHEYTPETMPEIPGVDEQTELPHGMLFCQGPFGDDWYVFRSAWPEGELCALVLPGGEVGAVRKQALDTAVPFGLRVIGIAGHDPDDPEPWRSYAGKIYNPATGAIAAPAVADVDQVDSVLAKIQLSRMKMPDGETSVLKALRAALVNADEETNLWFEGAKNWRIDDPRVQGLGAALDLSPEAIQAAFNEAAKIQV